MRKISWTTIGSDGPVLFVIDPVIHRIVLLGTLPTLPTDNNDGHNSRSPAIISLQKTHFSTESSFPVVEAISDFRLIEQNDIVSELYSKLSVLMWRSIFN